MTVDFDRDFPSESEDSDSNSEAKPPLQLAKGLLVTSKLYKKNSIQRFLCFSVTRRHGDAFKDSNNPKALVNNLIDESDTSSSTGGSGLEEDMMHESLLFS